MPRQQTIKTSKTKPRKTKIKHVSIKSNKSPTNTRALSSDLVHLSSEIKRINQRIVELERRGFTGTPAYTKIVTAKYGRENIITTKKRGVKTPTAKQGTTGGGLKIRTDVKNMSESEIKAVKRLIKEFTASPSTITELKKEKSKVVEYYNKYDLKEEITLNDVTDEMLSDYLEDVESISADAIQKAFYTKEYGFSDLYYRSEAGEKYADLKREAINALVRLKRTEGFSADNEPFDEDIIRLFYTGDI